MTIVPASPSSTVALMRQAPGAIEIFLVRRHDAIAFMGGAHVFPGGRVDAADHLVAPEANCDGVDAAASRMPALSRDEAVAYHVAAIRELFEEAGVLLARDANGQFVAIDHHNGERFHAYRHDLAARRVTMLEVVERERLRLALESLAWFAHWVTPSSEKRRFDTRFFAALAPDAQQAAHDQTETTEGDWTTPALALQQSRNGDITLPPATWTTLSALGMFTNVTAAMAWARQTQVPTIEPALIKRGDIMYVTLPGDPWMPAVDGFAAKETRFILENGRWQPVQPD